MEQSKFKSSLLCYLCCMNIVLCDVARVVWSYFYSLFGVEWVMPSSVLDLLSGWGTLLGRGSVIRI